MENKINKFLKDFIQNELGSVVAINITKYILESSFVTVYFDIYNNYKWESEYITMSYLELFSFIYNKVNNNKSNIKDIDNNFIKNDLDKEEKNILNN